MIAGEGFALPACPSRKEEKGHAIMPRRRRTHHTKHHHTKKSAHLTVAKKKQVRKAIAGLKKLLK